MPKSQPKRPAQQGAAQSPALTWRPLKKSRPQLIAASVLLAIWIVFLVAMAVYSQYH
jgi:hypothetical protein